jgi:hypothetical protein
MNRKLQLPAFVAASALALFCVNAQADQAPAASTNSQQTKMKTCNADATAKNLTGEDRKTYMSTCLSAKPAATTAAGNSQQRKMKTCNADATAKGLKGDERKAFMSTCLKGST